MTPVHNLAGYSINCGLFNFDFSKSNLIQVQTQLKLDIRHAVYSSAAIKRKKGATIHARARYDVKKFHYKL